MDSYLVPSAYGEASWWRTAPLHRPSLAVEREEEARARLEEVRRPLPRRPPPLLVLCPPGGNILRYATDGEPQGTAGQPMLNVLFEGGGRKRHLRGHALFSAGILLAPAGSRGLRRHASWPGRRRHQPDAALVVLMVPCPYPLYERMRLLVESAAAR